VAVQVDPLPTPKVWLSRSSGSCRLWPGPLSQQSCRVSERASARTGANLWPISYALTNLTDTEEIKIAKPEKKAVS